jgi:hypothetical protein
MRSVHSALPHCGVWAVCIVLILSHVSVGAEEACQFEAGGAFLYGWVEGSLQTPNGGQMITTSDDRPTLDELGIDNVSVFDFWMNVRRPRDGLYFGGQLIRLHGSSTLETELISQGRTFPAGSPVKAGVTFDWYRFGYSLSHFHQWGSRTLEIAPSLGAVLLTFDHHLTSPGLVPVDRSYAKGGAQMGVRVRSAITEKLTLSGQFFMPLALSNSVNILSAQATAEYQFLKRKDLEISGLLGIGYERIEYRDNQLMPNELRLEVKPMLLAGLEIAF